jgi:signal transduction histidine kinase
LIKKAPPRKDRFDLNEAVRDVIALTRSEVLKHSVSLQTQLAAGLPAVDGDRIQLQQVILNLILNAVEAMCGIEAGGGSCGSAPRRMPRACSSPCGIPVRAWTRRV